MGLKNSEHAAPSIEGNPALPLGWLRVVDCTRGTAGPRATGILADYGADVVWVEPPGGDPYRSKLSPEYSAFNRSKRSIEIDLRHEPGRSELYGLVAEADLFVESWQPGVARSLGVDYGTLQRVAPTLVYCSISGFGEAGAYRNIPGHESIVHALAGIMEYQSGHRDGPIYPALPQASLGAAYLAIIGSLSALYQRRSDGRGRRIETSLFDGALAYMMTWGVTDRDTSGHIPGDRRAVTRTFQCADEEFIAVHTGAVGAFNRLLDVLSLTDRIAPSGDGLDMSVRATAEEMQVLIDELPAMFRQRTQEQWLRLLLDAEVCAMPALRPGAVLDEAQTLHNQMIVDVEDSGLGELRRLLPALDSMAVRTQSIGTPSGLRQWGSIMAARLSVTAPGCERLLP